MQFSYSVPLFSSLKRVINSNYSTFQLKNQLSSISSISSISSLFSQKSNFITSSSLKREKVAIIGGGRWGTTVAKIVGQNVLKQSEIFHPELSLWVYEELHYHSEKDIQETLSSLGITENCVVTANVVKTLSEKLGHKISDMRAAQLLTEIGTTKVDDLIQWINTGGKHLFALKLTGLINQLKENPKYLPGIKLTSNITALPDLASAINGASIVVFASPNQYLPNVVEQMKGKVSPNTKAISLIKGLTQGKDGFQLNSHFISKNLNIDCSVMIGANMGLDLAQEKWSEATIGIHNIEKGQLFKKLFSCPYLKVKVIDDQEGVEICGALKNVVSLGAGIIDGLQFGSNAKAAVIRIGFLEMKRLAKLFIPSVKDSTFLESAGIADLVASCYGSNERAVAQAFIEAKGTKTFEQTEIEMFGFQKMDGPSVAYIIYLHLQKMGKENEFPLFTTIHHIVSGKQSPEKIIQSMANINK